jgi:hypothetical protein
MERNLLTERWIVPDQLVDGVPFLAHERTNFVDIGTGREPDHSVQALPALQLNALPLRA